MIDKNTTQKAEKIRYPGLQVLFLGLKLNECSDPSMITG